MGILSMWVISVPLCYLLGIFLKLGLIGVWIAYAADEWTRGIINIIRWKSRLWESMYVYKDKYYIFND
ncbi:MAG: MATE family efflux transporter, partial [Clostridiales bacterium]|nr:MATE family efflux transporter [Clostridiales bacterium]